jgi:hypothetical protein
VRERTNSVCDLDKEGKLHLGIPCLEATLDVDYPTVFYHCMSIKIRASEMGKLGQLDTAPPVGRSSQIRWHRIQ